MKKSFVKIISFLCALTLVFTAFPYAALADETEYNIYCDSSCIAVNEVMELKKSAAPGEQLQILFLRQEGTDFVSTVPEGQYVYAVTTQEEDVGIDFVWFIMPDHDVHINVLFGEKQEEDIDLTTGSAVVSEELYEFLYSNCEYADGCIDIDKDGTGDILFDENSTLTVTDNWKQNNAGIKAASYPFDGDMLKYSKINFIFKDESSYHTIIWQDEQGNVLARMENMPEGEIPEFPGTPTKPADANYTYVFEGWTPAVTAVTGDATYTAIFTAVPRMRTITWKDSDGTVLFTETIPMSQEPTNYTPEQDTKKDSKYEYKLIGWNTQMNQTTGDIVNTAIYTRRPYVRTITWINYDKTVLAVEENRPIDEEIKYKGKTPTRKADEKYKYTFKSWLMVVNNTTEDYTCTAQYTRKPIPISLKVPAKKSFKAKVKTKKISVTLKIGQKAAKAKKLTLTLNGKKYNAKTNSKGVAIFKIKLSKKGTFNYSVSYKGNPKNIKKSGKIVIK